MEQYGRRLLTVKTNVACLENIVKKEALVLSRKKKICARGSEEGREEKKNKSGRNRGFENSLWVPAGC
jgi:hypothetical protein